MLNTHRVMGMVPMLAALSFAIWSLAAPPPVLAAEGGGNSCPWLQDVTVDVDGKSLALGQDTFKPSGEPTEIDGHHVYPLLQQLKLRVVTPRGKEWEVSLTRLSGGKRCSAFYAGKAFPVLAGQEIYGNAVASR